MSSPASLFSDLTGYVERVAKLVSLDAALLTLETKASLKTVGIAAALFAGAAAFAFLGLIVLLSAVVLLLIQLGLAPSLSALLVAVALFIIAGVVAYVGVEKLKSWTLTPRRTMAQVASNLEALRASLRHDTHA